MVLYCHIFSLLTTWFCSNKAKVDQGVLVNNALREFSAFSDHKVNTHKIQVYFPNNMVDGIEDSLAHLLGFQRVNDLGCYLGVSVCHKRVMKSSFQFVIDKVRSQLNGWDAKLLSMVGRITLVKSIPMIIPNYYMYTTLISIGVHNKIENLVCNSIWGSTGRD